MNCHFYVIYPYINTNLIISINGFCLLNTNKEMEHKETDRRAVWAAILICRSVYNMSN